ncbi:glutamate--tRNA ligase [Flavobacterium sp.]|uniref:glutamate--tRNA ligase n=1 Tax=Flavobacterium sp. TaxID=239 RepID=UPI003B9AFFB6
MAMSVRVRFAPSPTGPLHIGGVRTALFNYLFAKKNKGTFYLRIEDTDQTRFVPGAEEYIFEALEWLGISPDETVGKNEKFGPYRQSERKHLYKQYADELVAKGFAYYAFDSAESLDALRKNAEKEGKTFIYGPTSRNGLENSLSLSAEAVNERLQRGDAYVIRFKTAADTEIYTQDIIRGRMRFETNLLDDKVLFKSDGMPTYHLANIVDDHLMETTHVIRGEEWLPSLPLHFSLYEAFGWQRPEFAHLPLLLKPQGNGKLSKRDGDKFGFPVFPLDWIGDDGTKSAGYREGGFFPEAVVNFLALLGWNNGTDQEIFSLEELSELFDLERVHKAGAKFDPEKNLWFNHQYLQKITDEKGGELYQKELALHGYEIPMNSAVRAFTLIKNRANTVKDFYTLTSYLYEAPTTYDEKMRLKWTVETTDYIEELVEVLQQSTNDDSYAIEEEVRAHFAKSNANMGRILPGIRLALVGEMKGPHVFDIIEVIGRAETVKRLQTGLQKIPL